MNKLKLRRDELFIDIVKIAIMITETKDFSAEVELAGFVGRFAVTIHYQDSDITIPLIALNDLLIDKISLSEKLSVNFG